MIGNDREFKMSGITEKEWAKIFLHLQVHHKGVKTIISNPLEVVVELDKKFIIAYLISNQEVIASTHPKNVSKLKEMLYHYTNCSCKIDDAINKSDSFEEALQILGVVKKK